MRSDSSEYYCQMALLHIDWLRLEDKKSSRIEFTIGVDAHNPDLWQSHIVWHLEYIQKLELL